MKNVDDDFLRRLAVGIHAFGFCEVHSGSRLKFAAGDAGSLHYCLTGRGIVRLEDGAVIAIRPDTLVLVPKGMGYGFEAGSLIRVETPGDWQDAGEETALRLYRSGEGDADPLVIACCKAFLRFDSGVNLLDLTRVAVAEERLDPGHLRQALRAAFDDFGERRFGARTQIETVLKELFIRILRRHVEAGNSLLSWIGTATDPRLGRALDFIDENLSGPLDIDRIAAGSGMSRTLLFQQFAAVLGKTPMRHVADARLVRAARLLLTTDRKIASVAAEVGYRSRSHFSRDFSRRYGADPSSYRRTKGKAHDFPPSGKGD